MKTNQLKNKIIKLSDSYNRSTNLELDFEDSSRLKNIYLSSKFQEGLKEIFNSVLEKHSKHRVRVLSGSPGLGKSTFALLTAQILSKRHPKIINEMMKQANRQLKNHFNAFQKSKNTKLLPVFLNGYEGEIEQVFNKKLQEALFKKVGLKSVKDSKNPLEYYKAALRILKKSGYSGIFVIYDEFGKYLERGVHNPTNLNIQFLQNFAEFCDRSGEKQCHLMLITHLSVSQYASQLPINVQQEWAKIEGRFQESAFYDKNADYYKMIAAVFKKNIASTCPPMAKKHKSYIKKYISHFKTPALEGFIDLKNIESILLNCFPLHPSVLALLPHLSKKVAQNERTLYTFLTRDENFSLKRFLEENFTDHNTLLMPYDLYKYFSPLIGKDIGIGGAYKVQLIAEEAFTKIDKKDNISKQIISLIALCSVIKDAHFTPLTESFIASCFNQLCLSTDIIKSLKKLKNKKVLFYNKNIKQYMLQEGSPIDIDEEITKLKSTSLTSKNLVQVLKRYFKTDFIMPKKYNFDNSITRFYRTEIISVEELKRLKASKAVDFYKEDGLIFYVVPFSHDELLYARSEVQSMVQPLCVFVLPKQFIECKKDIEELNAVDCLYHNKEILSASPLVKKELDRHKEILLSSISALLKPLIGYMALSVSAVYPREAGLKENSFSKNISHFKELQRFLGSLFEKEYHKYTPFNLEYVNRHTVSGSITLGRKKFIEALRLNKGKSKEDIINSMEGRGPDYVILDTMLRLSKFKFDSEANTYQVSYKSDYYKFFKEYESILKNHPQGINANELLNILTAPPYGLRLGVIPIFMALADLCFKQPVNHYFESAYVKELDGDHYDLLMRYPKKNVIHYTPIDNKQEKFLYGLKQIFKTNDISIHSVISALIRWRKTIPESTKLSSELSQAGRKMLIDIDSSTEPDKLLFERIPKCFNPKSIGLKTKNDEIQSVLLGFQNTKNEIDNVYKNLLISIKNELIQFIYFINRQCLNSILKQEIKKENLITSFKEVLFKIKEYPFSSNTSRFIGRILNFDASNHNQYFLETIADVLTGASPRYWDSKGYSKFEFALKSVKTEIELGSEIASPHFKGQSVLAFIDKGENKKTFIKIGAHSGVDERLLKSIEKINLILNSFDEIDKRKIILAILESMNKPLLKEREVEVDA